MISLAEVVARAERLYGDTSLEAVRAWKERHPGRVAVGHLPVYAPRDLIRGAGALPVVVAGGGDQVDIVKGDACFQSYLCHLPRSTVELGLTGDLDALDGMIFPSTCDVIRNLSGLWRLLFPGKYARYLDLPQCLDPDTAGAFYEDDLRQLVAEVARLGGRREPDPSTLAEAVVAHNENRRALRELYAFREQWPWLISADECFLLTRAGFTLDAPEHTVMLRQAIAAAPLSKRRREDRIRVLLIGAFCEQPPLGLLRSLERSGCYVVDDDLNQGLRFIESDVDPGRDPIRAVARAYFDRSIWASTRYEDDRPKGPLLVERVRRCGADGVVFAAPSFCDPALLDQPPYQKALQAAGVPFISFKYAENTGQFQGIREQAGTFADSLKLWGTA